MDLMDVTKIASGAVGLRIFDWAWAKLFPKPGPALSLSRTNVTDASHSDRVYPRVLDIENSGDATAFDLRWEVRRYYDSILPPLHEKIVGQQMHPLKPGESFRVETITDRDEPTVPGAAGLCLADFYSFEILVRCRDLKKRRYLAHFSIDLAGTLVYQDFCVSLIPRLLLPTTVWLRHASYGLRVYAMVRLRRISYYLLNWLRGSSPPRKL
jgi:hypothetical protein